MKTQTAPLLERESVKGIIFTTLSKEHPLKLIDLTNIMRKRHGKSITFQAVRKAAMGLVEEGVLEKNDKEYRIKQEWVLQTKQVIDDLHRQLAEKQVKPKHLETAGEDVRVFTFNTVNEMMKFWEDIIDDWYAQFKKGDPHINCYQGAHLWEGILHLDRERVLMGQLKKKGIVSYAVCTGSTPLDRSAVKFYESIGLKVHIVPSTTSFDRSHYIATYGELIVEATYPEEIVKALDMFFRKNKNIEQLDLKELSEIVNRKAAVKLTVIRNLRMAEHVNQSMISMFR